MVFRAITPNFNQVLCLGQLALATDFPGLGLSLVMTPDNNLEVRSTSKEALTLKPTDQTNTCQDTRDSSPSAIEIDPTQQTSNTKDPNRSCKPPPREEPNVRASYTGRIKVNA